MTRRQLSLLLGIACQAGCLVYDEPLGRDRSDASEDVRHDPSLRRDADVDSLRDVDDRDEEASAEASNDALDPHDGSWRDVARDGDTQDALNDVADAAIDVNADVAPPFDADASSDVAIDAFDGGTVRDADATSDPFTDPPIVGCTVDFTVSGVGWEDDGPIGEGGVRVVRVVGGLGPLGEWTPAEGLAMIEKAPGAWAASFRVSDGVVFEFKFVKIDGDRPPEWEQWLPLDSNRSLRVDCSSDGGILWIDAGTEGGPLLRALGKSYGGAFGVRPLDATK
jgi:hypothetical protein